MLLHFLQLIVSVSILLSLFGCSTTPTPKPVADAPTFQQPTATQVFTLRTKCAELGEKINGAYDLTGISLATSDDLPYPFTQEHFSHYDPKTNRCYVELRVAVASGALTTFSAKNATTRKRRDEFLARYDLDFLERHLYDGQTGEELASFQKGIKMISPSGVIKGRSTKAEWFDAAQKIDELMDDEGKP